MKRVFQDTDDLDSVFFPIAFDFFIGCFEENRIGVIGKFIIIVKWRFMRGYAKGLTIYVCDLPSPCQEIGQFRKL